jgi:predicted Zn-dependent protease
MTPMGREANELILAGREAFRPTEADRARLMAAIAGTTTLSLGAAVATDAARRSLSSLLSAVPAVRALAVALPLAAAGAYGWRTLEDSSSNVQKATVVQASRVTVAPRPTPVVPPLPEEPVTETVEAPLVPPVPSTTMRQASPSREVSKSAVEIREEVALLSRAQAALSRGRPQEALEALSEHTARFPRGVLAEERAATRARTLCALGRKQEAEVELKRMEKVNPASAYLARARESCAAR